jgi:hypothetical protein
MADISVDAAKGTIRPIRRPLVDRFHETDHIEQVEFCLHGPHPEEPCKAQRLEGWTLARSRLWPSFETRARARSSGRGLIDDIDMIRTSETVC